jgi:hypothetical protein
LSTPSSAPGVEGAGSSGSGAPQGPRGLGLGLAPKKRLAPVRPESAHPTQDAPELQKTNDASDVRSTIESPPAAMLPASMVSSGSGGGEMAGLLQMMGRMMGDNGSGAGGGGGSMGGLLSMASSMASDPAMGPLLENAMGALMGGGGGAGSRLGGRGGQLGSILGSLLGGLSATPGGNSTGRNGSSRAGAAQEIIGFEVLGPVLGEEEAARWREAIDADTEIQQVEVRADSPAPLSDVYSTGVPRKALS